MRSLRKSAKFAEAVAGAKFTELAVRADFA